MRRGGLIDLFVIEDHARVLERLDELLLAAVRDLVLPDFGAETLEIVVLVQDLLHVLRRRLAPILTGEDALDRLKD